MTSGPRCPSATERTRPWSSAGREPEAVRPACRGRRAPRLRSCPGRPRSARSRRPRPTPQVVGAGARRRSARGSRARRRGRRRPRPSAASSHLAEMSCSIGVVIQPSAFSAIQRNVFGPPPAPMTTGIVRLDGLRPGPGGAERHELAVVRRLFLRSTARASPRRTRAGPCGACPAGTWWSSSSSVFQPNPAPIGHPAAGEVVEGGDRLGERDRVGLDRQRDRGREPDPSWSPRRRSRARPTGRGCACSGRRAASRRRCRVRGVAPDRDVGVLGHVERVEPALLGRLRGAAGVIPRSLVNRTMPWRTGAI